MGSLLMRIRDVFLNTATGLAVLCAVGMTANAYRNGFLFSRTPAPRDVTAKTKIPQWRSFFTGGHRIGPANAAVTIVEFGDFECPACAGFARRIDSVRKRYPTQFAIVFHHLPLPYHKLAYPLARASECAAAQDRFVEFHDAVYAHPESVTFNSIAHLGVVAGVRDTMRFQKCFADTKPIPAIDSDVSIAAAIGVRGTPGIIFEGELLGGTVHNAEIERLIQARQRTGAQTPNP